MADTPQAAAYLSELDVVTVDELLSDVDAGSSYRALYYRWEGEQWEAGAVDLADDRAQWTSSFTSSERRSLLWALSLVRAGEQTPEALVPFVDAAPEEEQQVFLTTQLADEARHVVLFDRLRSELIGDAAAGDGARGAPMIQRTAPLHDLLERASAEIAERGDLASLVEGVVVHHLVVEWTVGLTAQRFLLDDLRARAALPGLRRALTAVARDRARHVCFALRLLQQAVSREPHYAGVVTARLRAVLPDAMLVFRPAAAEEDEREAMAYGERELRRYAQTSLSKRLAGIGLRGALADL